MQKISFKTSAGTIEIDDVNISSLTGEKVLRLGDVDCNSAKTRIEAAQCMDMPGQKVLSSTADVKTVVAKIAFAPVYLINNRLICTGSKGMYHLRREVLRHFPLGETGTLTYTNDVDTYVIRARIDEMPVVTTADGYFCECTVMFTCDYPYWCKDVKSEIQTVSNGGSCIFTPPVYGDIASPVGGIIKCNQDLGGSSYYNIFFRLKNVDYRIKQINFCRQLKAGNSLEFNFLYNNEWTVLFNGGYETIDSIYFPEYCEPCINYPGKSKFEFQMYCDGELEVQLIYHNLFVAV